MRRRPKADFIVDGGWWFGGGAKGPNFLTNKVKMIKLALSLASLILALPDPSSRLSEVKSCHCILPFIPGQGEEASSAFSLLSSPSQGLTLI